MQSTAKTVDAYMSELPEDRRAIISALDSLIRNCAPELTRANDIFMMYGMIGYGKYHYTYASGREGDWAAIALASQKNYISLYLCAADEHGYIPEQNKDRLGKVSVGKSCIRFKKLEDLNLEVVKELVVKTLQLTKNGKFAQ